MNSSPPPPRPPAWKTSYLALVATLLRRRQERCLGQAALAVQLGVSRRTLQRWECGEAEPPAMRLFQWAARLGVGIAPNVAQSGAGAAR